MDRRDALDLLDLADDRRAGLLVFKVRATGQDARAVGAADHDLDILRQRRVHQTLQRAVMVEKSVATRQQKTVRLRFAQIKGQFARLDLVHPQAPALDHAFFAQAGQHLEGTGAGLVEVLQPLIAVEVLGDVMHPDDVQAIGLQALEAVFDGTQGGIGTVVIGDLVRATVFEHPALLAQVAGRGVFDFIEDHPADLAAEHIVVAVVAGQCGAEANFRQAGTVERRGIEVTHAGVPGGMDGGHCLVFGNGAEHVAQWCGAQAQRAGQFVFQAHGGSS
ncbi:hypothetical protein D9M71_315210 [compost metagenome]